MLSMEKWSSESEAMLEDCFARADWNMFRYSADSIDKLTTSINGFIRKYISDVVPTVTVHFPNQKPWINTEVGAKLKNRFTAQRAIAANTEATAEDTKSHYDLHRAIKQAK